MKEKFICTLLLSLLLTSCSQTLSSSSTSSSVTLKNIDVIVLCGQSNAEGCSNWQYFDEDEKTKYREGFEHTKIRYKCGTMDSFSRKFVNVKTGQANTVYTFGPELGMAEYFEDNYSFLQKDVYIIKYTYGGTALYDLWRSPSSSDSLNAVGELYEGLIDYCDESINLLKNSNFNPTIRAVCWMQGESDAGSTAHLYQKLENNFINDLNEDLKEYSNEEKIKFLDAGISNSPAWANYQIINNAKKENVALDEENRFYIDTISEGLTYDQEPAYNPDLCHYDSKSMIKLGHLFAEVLIENAIIDQD